MLGSARCRSLRELALSRHDRDDETEGDAPGVAPGALSALLKDLAEVEESLPDAPLPPAGTVIGRFELLREIGGGGFGVVYEARDKELGRSVAFKLVRPGRLEAGADQLGREAEVIAALSHPNLVTLFDVGRCEHGPYLILELLRGGTLEAHLRQGPLPASEAMRVATEIARGLAHAHAQGVVHRDLKPSNVFLCQDGLVKLLDFGMSHAFGRRRVSGGTPAYMAPEQWRGSPEDERTDVYALGVMVFEMLTRKLPFSVSEKGKAVPSPRRAPALDVPGEAGLAELVARMLEKDATRRPRDGAEVLAGLEALHARADHTPGGAPAAGGRIRARARPRWALALGALLLAAALAAGWAWWAGSGRTPSRPAIVVLPFANLSGSPADEYLSDGLTEEMILTLARLRELKVAARSSSFYFKGRQVEVGDLASRLGVDVVLEGSVRRDRDHLRVAAQLVDARSGFHLWAETYDRRLEDTFAVQDDIAHQVVGMLELVLSSASKEGLRRPAPASLAAYDLYLRARAELRRPSSPETLGRATALLEQALASDATFAQAHAALCEAWLARYVMDRTPHSVEKAEAACTRARALDPKAGEVYVALGSLHLASGRYDRAEQELRSARALPSGEVDALLGLARVFAAQRRVEEAERAFEQAAKAAPGYWRVYALRGNFQLQRGRHAEAAQSYAREVALTPEDPRAHTNLGAAHWAAGDVEKAAQAWETSLRLAPTAGAYSNTGTGYFYLGRFAEAAEMYRRASELAPGDHRLLGNLADAWARVPGHEADAAAAYARAVTLGEERLRLNPADANAMADLAHYHASLGHAEKARALGADALRRDPESAYVHYGAALVSARLGLEEQALEEIERAVALGHERHLLARDPGLASLREAPRFQALLPAREVKPAGKGQEEAR